MIRTGWNNVINVVKYGLILKMKNYLMPDLLKNTCCDEPAISNVFDKCSNNTSNNDSGCFIKNVKILLLYYTRG